MNNNIKNAFSETVSARYESFCENPVKHRFSFAYKLKKRLLIKRYNADKVQSVRCVHVKSLKIAILAILLAVLAVMGFSMRHSIDGFSFQKYPEYSRLYIDAEDTLRSSVETVYLIPGEYGYIASNKRISSDSVIIDYTCGESKFVFKQTVSCTVPYINTEGCCVEEIKINGNEGFLIQMDDEVYLSWVEDGYIFTVRGNIDKNKALELAEITKNKKSVKNMLT